METLEKVKNIIKSKFNSEFMYIKNYLKSEKKCTISIDWFSL